MPRRSMCQMLQVGYLVAVAAVTALLAGPSMAQEKAAAKEGAKAPAVAAAPGATTAGAKTVGKKAKKAAARLPAHYGQVVDQSQRDKIVAILAEYNGKIKPLKAQLDALTKERDEKVAAVLTPEQAKKVEALKAASQAKRQATKEAKARQQAK